MDQALSDLHDGLCVSDSEAAKSRLRAALNNVQRHSGPDSAARLLRCVNEGLLERGLDGLVRL